MNFLANPVFAEWISSNVERNSKSNNVINSNKIHLIFQSCKKMGSKHENSKWPTQRI